MLLLTQLFLIKRFADFYEYRRYEVKNYLDRDKFRKFLHNLTNRVNFLCVFWTKKYANFRHFWLSRSDETGHLRRRAPRELTNSDDPFCQMHSAILFIIYLRVQSAPPLLLLFLHDQGITKIDPIIVKDFELSCIEESSGATQRIRIGRKAGGMSPVGKISPTGRSTPHW